MNDIVKFVNSYLDWEIRIKKGKYDLTITDEEHQVNISKYKQFFTKELVPFALVGWDVRNLESKDPQIVKKNYTSRVRRTLFLIRYYKNSKFGNGVFVDSNEFYSCTVSNDSIHDDILFYGQNLCVSKVNGKFKVFCIRNEEFVESSGRITWRVGKKSPSKEHGVLILQEGNLSKVKKIKAPEFEESLADYNFT